MVNLLEILTKRNSGTIAKKRLQFLLISDRAGCTPEIFEMIKDDMIKAISKYMEIDTDGLEIKITQMGPGPVDVFRSSMPASPSVSSAQRGLFFKCFQSTISETIISGCCFMCWP